MELNEKPEPNDVNPKIVHLVTSLFGKPHLPIRLAVLLVLVILTEYAYGLLREPSIYWFDYSRDILNPMGGFKFGPFIALGIYLVYVSLLWIVFRILNRKIALVLWGGFVILHLSTFTSNPPSCNYDVQKYLPGWLCSFDSNLIIFIIGLILGLALAWGAYEEQKNLQPASQGTLLSKFGLSKATLALFASWLLLLAIGIGFVSRTPPSGWKPVVTKHSPTPRYEAMISYNAQSNKALLFGGAVEASSRNWTEANDTWEWDGKDWTQLNPQHSPPARARGVLAYDPKRNITILFGGWNNLKKSLNDTWLWDGKDWHEVGTCASCYQPPSRGCQNMFYDTVRKEIVMYGGCNENQMFFNDAWSWNGEQWEIIDIKDSPTASGAPIVYDSKNQWAVGFLAWQPTGTWFWDKNGWSKPITTTEPPIRGNSMMANDAETGNSLMFGGTRTENNLITFYTDTWVINGMTWSEISSSLKPPGRWGHVLFFDTKLKKFMLFGGFDGESALNDLWEINIDSNNKLQ